MSIINGRTLKALSQWFARLTCPDVATASHQVGHTHMGSFTSSFVDYGRWPDSARSR